MARIFISHASRNNAEAIAIRDWLVANGWDDLFLDLDPERGIVPGERWQDALIAASQRCELVLFLLSPDWVESEWCRREFWIAKSQNKRLLGAVIAPMPSADLPAEMTVEWQLVDLTAQPRTIHTMVNVPGGGRAKKVSFSEIGLSRLRAGLQAAGLDAKYFAWPPQDDPERPPYRGLRPLEAGDAGIFFGRDGAIVEALDRLRGMHEAAPPRMLVILGASGSGKSSFLRAGLLPRIARDDRHFLPLPVVRSERAAITGETGLIASLTSAFKSRAIPKTRAAVRTAVEGGSAPLGALLGELRGSVDREAGLDESMRKPPTLILPVDQGEELYLAEGAEESDMFLTLVRDLLAADSPSLMVLFTIRSDAYEHLQLDERLEGMRQQTLSLPPMPHGAYADVITGPALRLEGTGRSLRIEEPLTDALLTDIEAGGAKDALPLLAFTMERLYVEYGDDGDLKLSEYEELGRIRGSIEAAVESVLAAADADPAVPKDRKARLALLRRGLIPWLAGIDPDTGAPRRRVARFSEIPDEARPLILHLVEQRLLSTDVSQDTGEVTIEPAHEALLRQWSLLEGWLEEDFEVLTVLEGVKRAARDWQANDRDPAWLAHSGGRLESAERVAAREGFAEHLQAGERAYITAARNAENARLLRERRSRRFVMFGSFAASVVLLIISAFAGWNWFRAEDQKRAAESAQEVAEQRREEAEGARTMAEEQRIAAERARVIAEQRRVEAENARTATETQRNDALRAESLFLSDLSRRENEKGDAVTGILLALEGLRDEQADSETQRARPYVASTEFNLLDAVMARKELNVLKGHEERVLSARFSADGSRIVTASWDRTARLWDVSTGEVLAILRGHLAEVLSAEFSPDGSRVLTASADNTARLWDAATGAEIAVLRGHSNSLSTAVYSSDGSLVVTASWDKTARLWDAHTGALIAVLHGHGEGVRHAAFAPDGSRVVTASVDKTARLWDAATGAQVAVLGGHEDVLLSASFSPDGGRIVTVPSARTARLWDAATGALIAELTGHEAWLQSAAFSPDGSRIVTTSWDKTARIWNGVTGSPVAVLRGHDDKIQSAAFSPDGLRVVTASWDRTMRMWDAAAGTRTAIFRGHEDKLNSAEFSPDGSQLITTSLDRTVRLWDAATGSQAAVLKGHEGTVESAVFSSDGAYVVTSSQDFTARVWDVKTGTQVVVLKGHEDYVWQAAFSPDGSRIVTVSNDQTARVWDAVAGTQLAVLRGHEEKLHGASFSPDGAHIVTTSQDFTARLWDAETGVQLAVLTGHESWVNNAAFSPDGSRVVTASDDGTARVWDVATAALESILRGHASGVRKVAFSPDGKRIVSASWDFTARLWDVATGRGIGVLRGHQDFLSEAAFSPDGSRVVTSSWDNTARIWDVATATQIAVLEGHEGLVWSAAFSPDGSRVVTASFDHTARLWDAATAAQLAVYRGHERLLNSVAFSPDGLRIVTSSDDKSARLWDVDMGTRGESPARRSVASRRAAYTVRLRVDAGTHRPRQIRGSALPDHVPA